ncbi:MAG: phage tail protein [Desulfovibrionaceae bacterium]
MTISTTHSYLNYTGDNVQKNFPITFPFNKEEDIKAYCMYYRASENNYIKQELFYLKDYTIRKGSTSSSLQLKESLQSQDELVLFRDNPLVQNLKLENGTRVDAKALEKTFDNIVMMLQDIAFKHSSMNSSTLSEVQKLHKDALKILADVAGDADLVQELYKLTKKLYDDLQETFPGTGGGGSGDGNVDEEFVRKIVQELILQHNKITSAHMNSLIPTGCISYFLHNTAPDGWLILEKKLYNITEYAKLADYLYPGDDLNATATFGYRVIDKENPEESRDPNGSYFMLGPDIRGEFIRCADSGRDIDRNRVVGSSQAAISGGSHFHELYTMATGVTPGPIQVYTANFGDPIRLHYTSKEELAPRNIALLTCIKY